jgi:H+-translocating NAD(P) transhydrogenase subunit alpha
MFSNNLSSFLLEYWDKETKIFKLDTQDEIIKNCLVTHAGQIFNEIIKRDEKREIRTTA